MITALIVAAQVAASPVMPATLDRVIDGDTIDVWLEPLPDTRLRRRCRLLEIDTPEMHTGLCRAAGRMAKKAVQRRLDGAGLSVQIEGKDRYGRDLCRVWAGGEDLSAWLLAEGLAGPYVKGKRWCPAAAITTEKTRD